MLRPCVRVGNSVSVRTSGSVYVQAPGYDCIRSFSVRAILPSSSPSIPAVRFCTRPYTRHSTRPVSIVPRCSLAQTVFFGTKSHAMIDLSLHRITALLEHLGNPQAQFPIIHVAGTNAKGSTIAYLRTVLTQAVGLRTGTFTSPHLCTQRDSCQVDGLAVDESVWEEAGKVVQDAAEQVTQGTCTPFEILTAQAFVAFKILPEHVRPQILLVEVGMGGRTDATNVFFPRQVLASVITAIDWDHQSLLGSTLGQIASHKAGIVQENGLCVMADQQEHATSFDPHSDGTRLPVEQPSALGDVHNAIRQTCIDKNARLVRSYLPWAALQSIDNQRTADTLPWYAGSTSHVRYNPTLSLSKVRTGEYVASTGDAVVPGPLLRVPATRAALMGAHLALQTLWSIARDETPCGLGIGGHDAFEDLRLQIAWTLRDDPIATATLQKCVESVQLAGRAEWRSLGGKRMQNQSNQSMDLETTPASHDGTEAIPELEPPSVPLTALVDGAHNPSAARALRQYVESCVTQRVQREQQHSTLPVTITLTWILAFSQGKAVSEMLDGLLGPSVEESKSSDLTSQMSQVSLHGTSAVRFEHRLACVSFSTPVEGMPWVQPCDPHTVSQLVRSQSRSNVIDIQAFHGPCSLQEALDWTSNCGLQGSTLATATNHEGKTVLRGDMIIIAGSLYLVSDVHRL